MSSTVGALSVSVMATVSVAFVVEIFTVLATAPPPTTDETAKLTLDVPSYELLSVGV